MLELLFAELAPVAAIVGGILGQEVLHLAIITITIIIPITNTITINIIL